MAGSATEAVLSIWENAQGLTGAFVDPLGLDIGDVSDSTVAAEEQGVETATLTNMAALFGSQFAAFCYLVFILLYAPCVAVLGAMAKEGGWRWMLLIFAWTTSVAYVSASVLYQLGNFSNNPVFAGSWIAVAITFMVLFIVSLKKIGPRSLPDNLIPAVQLT